MKRKEIEFKVRGLRADAAARIQTAPIAAFFVGILLGIVVTIFPRLVLTLVVFAVLVVAALWLFADSDETGKSPPQAGDNGGQDIV